MSRYRKSEHKGKETLKQMSNVNYYEIKEEAARRAKEMNSFSSYVVTRHFIVDGKSILFSTV